MKPFKSQFTKYSITNLKRLAFFYKQDFEVKKFTEKRLRRKYGYNCRLNLQYIKTTHANKLEQTLRRRVTVYNLKHRIQKYLAYVKSVNSYRSHRHRIFLPVRGQRTKTNAKTNRKKNRKK